MGKDSRTILGLLAGAAVGMVAGVLMAPDKGSETRKRIANEANNFKDRVVDEFDRVSTDISQKVSTKKASLDDEVENIMSNASYKAEDVISTLEKKLADLKAKNKKYQKA